VTHLDEGAFSYLLETFKPQTFLDIGCGPGGMLEIAKNNGVSCLGIDGDMSLFKTWQSKNIVGVCNDYSESGIITGFFDLCWSVEFFEHIEELYLVNVFRTLKNCK
jgi:cyclopropane fatty-acyl-phospholipid synthase-like methyltransferase